MLAGGCGELASSRVSQLRALKEKGIEAPFFWCGFRARELPDVARWADRSLQSDIGVLEALDREADRAGRSHGVVLMMDLGDLREGWSTRRSSWPRPADGAEFRALELLGVGTNLGATAR
jgi:predicted amino acid racemase